MLDKIGRAPAGVLILAALMTMAVVLYGCSTSGEDLPPAETLETGPADPQTIRVPLVTLKHWKDSTPGERYSFLIGFVTMLELEKEWQGKGGRELLPFDRSLISGWVRGFENRPLTEIYNGLNRYIADKPGDLDRPAAEVMWFLFAQPRMPAEGADDSGGPTPEDPRPKGQSKMH